MRTLVVMLSLVTSPVMAAPPASCTQPEPAEVAALFDRWNASLQTGDAARVAANYADVAILLPTLSNQPRLTPAARMAYFEHFLEKRPSGRIDSRFIEAGCNVALDSGLYTFTFGDGSSARARYTFTYTFNGSQWLISSHHSSLMPE